MILSLYILIILIGVIIRPKLRIFEYVPLVFMCITLYFSHDVPDFASYESVYNHIGKGYIYIDTGLGWYYLCKVGNILGLNYRLFSIIIYAVSIILINRTIKGFVTSYRYRNIVWIVYLIFPALLDAVQIRFFFAEALVIFGCQFLIKKDIKGYIAYTVLCCFAFTVHTSAVFYLLFLLGPVLKRIQKYLVGLVAFTTLFMILGRNLIYRIASNFVNSVRIERYFNSDDAVGVFGIIAYLATLILFLEIARYYFEKSKHRYKFKNCMGILGMEHNSENNGFFIKNNTTDLSELFYQMSVLIWLVMPLTLFDTNFFRIQRPLWLMLYIICASMIEKGIIRVKVGGGKIPPIKTKYLIVAVAVIGFVFYICIFNFNVISSFLL